MKAAAAVVDTRVLFAGIMGWKILHQVCSPSLSVDCTSPFCQAAKKGNEDANTQLQVLDWRRNGRIMSSKSLENDVEKDVAALRAAVDRLEAENRALANQLNSIQVQHSLNAPCQSSHQITAEDDPFLTPSLAPKRRHVVAAELAPLLHGDVRARGRQPDCPAMSMGSAACVPVADQEYCYRESFARLCEENLRVRLLPDLRNL